VQALPSSQSLLLLHCRLTMQSDGEDPGDEEGIAHASTRSPPSFAAEMQHVTFVSWIRQSGGPGLSLQTFPLPCVNGSLSKLALHVVPAHDVAILPAHRSGAVSAQV
jgi:hypothetical protein